MSDWESDFHLSVYFRRDKKQAEEAVECALECQISKLEKDMEAAVTERCRLLSFTPEETYM